MGSGRIRMGKKEMNFRDEVALTQDIKTQIENATLEAIYWWNRDEDYYHTYFSKFDKIYNDKELLEFFTGKIFETFLLTYRVRRNISKGYIKVDDFIKELFDYNFVGRVNQNDTQVIDEVSLKIKTSGKATNNQTISLLSKIAFLIKPNKFVLYDGLAKTSLYHVLRKNKKTKCTQKVLETYSVFIDQSDLLRVDLRRGKFFVHSKEILEQFKNTKAFDFYSKNNEAFEKRIVDKYLWLLGQDPTGRKLENKEYLKLNKMR